MEITEVDINKANATLDKLTNRLKLKNDAALSRALQVAPPVISKIRHGSLPFGVSLVVRAHEITGIPVRDLKKWLGQESLRPMLMAA